MLIDEYSSPREVEFFRLLVGLEQSNPLPLANMCTVVIISHETSTRYVKTENFG